MLTPVASNPNLEQFGFFNVGGQTRRFPTVRLLAEFLVATPGGSSTATAVAPERVQARRDGADRRRLLLERRNKPDERD